MTQNNKYTDEQIIIAERILLVYSWLGALLAIGAIAVFIWGML